ncbi:MAG: ABC transporter ATP-binding protein [Peptoniphilaceae bacterium]
MKKSNIENKKELNLKKERELNKKFEKPKNFRKSLKKLLNYLKDYKLSLILMIIFSLLSVIFTIYGPKVLGSAVNKIYEGLIGKIGGNPNAFDFEGIKKILLFILGLYITSSIFSYIKGILVARVAQKISFKMRRELSLKINRLPLNYFDKKTHGEILSRVINDVDKISTTLNQSVSQIISSLVTIIGVLIMMLSISFKMTLAALLIIPISALIVGLIVKNSQKYFKENSKTVGLVNSHVEEAFAGYQIIKAFNGEKQTREEFSQINDKLYDSSWKSQFVSSMMMPMINFIGNLGYVFVSILGGYLAIRKDIQVGDIVSFIQYIRSFTRPMSQVAQMSSVLQSTLASAERVFEVLDEEELEQEENKILKEEDVKGRVTFKNVNFGYKENETIIEDFSCDIKPGMKIAIVGPTGAGKTTLIKLLLRFYELNSGSIKIDGVDIREYTRDSLRGIFGMVLQDTWLFNGSIKDNIKYGDLNKTDEEVIEASKAAHAHHFIMTQPNGYELNINEQGNNISQGQKQLITIARAILSDPKILILDEATSSVDTRTESLIQKGMEKLSEGKTSFIIAHRLSTIVDADLILVLNEGNIVEQGNHEELLEKDGFYADLYKSQFEVV